MSGGVAVRTGQTTRPPRAGHAPGVDLRRAARLGLISGGSAVFVAAIGMVQSFAGRQIVDPWVTLGYLVLFLVPFGFGYLAGRPPPTLEGYEDAPTGPRNAVAGLVAGLGTAGLLAVFVLVADALNLQRIFVNISPALVGVLTFHSGLGTGILLLALGSVAVATAGGALHLLPDRWRHAVLTGVLWMLTIGLLRELVAQIFRGLRVPEVNRLLFAPAGGLTLVPALVVLGLFLALDLYLRRRPSTVRRRVEAMSPAERRGWAAVAIAVLVVVLAFTPVVLGTFMSEILDLVGIFLLMALGLNIVVGYAGLLDLGYVAFFAVGAYVAAVLTSPLSPTLSPALSFWLALPFVMLAAALAGVLVGTPVLRMRGDYLAIVTLGFGEIARILFQSDWLKPYFGGAQGITRIPGIPIAGKELNTPPEFFYPIAVLVLLAAYVSWALYNSRTGRAWIAMREDEPIAEALGINIVTAKLSAFIIGAILASFGGAVFASKIGSIFPNSFNIIVSIIVLVIIIVGGMGSLPGVAVGALVIQGIPQLLREFEDYQFLLYGALLIYMMIAKPEGLIPSRRRAQELHQEEMMQDAWLTRDAEQEEREAPASTPERDPDAGLT